MQSAPWWWIGRPCWCTCFFLKLRLAPLVFFQLVWGQRMFLQYSRKTHACKFKRRVPSGWGHTAKCKDLRKSFRESSAEDWMLRQHCEDTSLFRSVPAIFCTAAVSLTTRWKLQRRNSNSPQLWWLAHYTGGQTVVGRRFFFRIDSIFCFAFAFNGRVLRFDFTFDFSFLTFPPIVTWVVNRLDGFTPHHSKRPDHRLGHLPKASCHWHFSPPAPPIRWQVLVRSRPIFC